MLQINLYKIVKIKILANLKAAEFVFQLIGLKAELSKKQEEVQKVTAQSENRYIPAPVRKEKQTVLTKQNPGVNERIERDNQLDVEEIDLQRKSRYFGVYFRTLTRLY